MKSTGKALQENMEATISSSRSEFNVGVQGAITLQELEMTLIETEA
jgi:hypothetical protein